MWIWIKNVYLGVSKYLRRGIGCGSLIWWTYSTFWFKFKGGLKSGVIQGYRVWYCIRLDWIKGEKSNLIFPFGSNSTRVHIREYPLVIVKTCVLCSLSFIFLHGLSLYDWQHITQNVRWHSTTSVFEKVWGHHLIRHVRHVFTYTEFKRNMPVFITHTVTLEK